MQCRHARGGDSAVLPVAGRGSEPDASGDEQLNLSARAYHRIFEIQVNKTQSIVICTTAMHNKGELVFPKELYAPVLYRNLHQDETVGLGAAAQLHQAT
jgi:hypothetical protein